MYPNNIIFDKVYYSISEISKLLNVSSSTLRYWESLFKQIQPMRLAGNRRVYSVLDLNIITKIQFMLYVEKLSINDVQKKIEGISRKELGSYVNTTSKESKKSILINKINETIEYIDRIL